MLLDPLKTTSVIATHSTGMSHLALFSNFLNVSRGLLSNLLHLNKLFVNVSYVKIPLKTYLGQVDLKLI